MQDNQMKIPTCDAARLENEGSEGIMDNAEGTELKEYVKCETPAIWSYESDIWPVNQGLHAPLEKISLSTSSMEFHVIPLAYRAVLQSYCIYEAGLAPTTYHLRPQGKNPFYLLFPSSLSVCINNVMSDGHALTLLSAKMASPCLSAWTSLRRGMHRNPN